MRIFSYLYRKILTWSEHLHAPYYLAGVSFVESFIFPIPPDPMLISMTLAKPHNAWRYASLTTVSSVSGGIFGYLLGAFSSQLVDNLIHYLGYQEAYQTVLQWFADWGFWALLIAGFSPIPYKLFTIGAGIMHMAFLPFVIASIIGRAARFFLVAWLLTVAGIKVREFVHRYIDRIGWVVVLLLVLFMLLRAYR